jgi:hypothetical protein
MGILEARRSKAKLTAPNRYLAKWIDQALKPARPITRLATMVSNGQYLNKPIDLAVNDVKVKDLEHGASNVWHEDDSRARWGGAGARQGLKKISVIASAQPRFSVFIVGDLLFVFPGGLGVNPIAHLKRALT